MGSPKRLALLPGILAATLVANSITALAYGPAAEARNYAKTQERQTIYDTPAYQAQLRTQSAQNTIAANQAQAGDPERNFIGHVCATESDGCAGDVRLYQWQSAGYGTVQKVLFTARSGATVSGHVWATRAGPAKRPGIVITNGSLQADEQLYWFVAQALAKAGYVVLTSDPQGQGQSDEFGEAPDQREGEPAQTDGRPFFDGTEDALNFFLSTPAARYEPVPSCSTGTSHAPKQDRRVAAGLDTAFNPFWSLLDRSRIGLAGHSYGASGVSYIGQWDPRVKAVVAFDNLGPPDPNRDFNGGPIEQPCPSNPAARAVVPITKPALGMSADYFLTPTPYTSDPDPMAKSQESLAYTAAGVDTGEIVIRGGTHYEFSWIPNHAFGATLRGADLVAWYATAWFDRYVKGDPEALRRLLTERWQADALEAAIDLGHDGNLYSFYYRSRLDVATPGGGRFDCEDLRRGCPAMVAHDGWPGTYSYLAVDTSPDRG